MQKPKYTLILISAEGVLQTWPYSFILLCNLGTNPVLTPFYTISQTDRSYTQCTNNSKSFNVHLAWGFTVVQVISALWWINYAMAVLLGLVLSTWHITSSYSSVQIQWYEKCEQLNLRINVFTKIY